MEINRLIIVIKKASNRQERRVHEKEVEEIKKELLPMFYAFDQVYSGEQTEHDLAQAESVFITKINQINKNKKFVLANKNSFRLTFSTQEEISFASKNNSKIKWYAVAIIAFILAIVLLSIFV